MDKKKYFNVTIDLESWYAVIEANSKEEAEEIACKEYELQRDASNEHPDFWVGDCCPVEE